MWENVLLVVDGVVFFSAIYGIVSLYRFMKKK
jgi:hypothetical protein